MVDGTAVEYDPFNSYPVDYNPWAGQSPFQKIKGHKANVPVRPQYTPPPEPLLDTFANQPPTVVPGINAIQPHLSILRQQEEDRQKQWLMRLMTTPGSLDIPDTESLPKPTGGGGARFRAAEGSSKKAVTANTRRDEMVPSAKDQQLPPEVLSAIHSIQGILAKPQINALYDIPYGWGSNDKGGLTYRDKRIPSLIKIAGKGTNVDKYLHIHEQIERILMLLLRYPYKLAHHIATMFERAAVEADGIDWVAYETAINKLLEVTEKETHANLPNDLFVEAYDAKDLEAFMGGQGHKKDKKSVDYSKGKPQENCGNCKFFVPTGQCVKVKGSIERDMWCKLWKKEGP